MYKRITLNELDLLKSISKEIWFDTYKHILSVDQITYMLDKFFNAYEITKLNYYFIVDEEVVGFFAYSESNYIELSKLYIKKQHQNKGYAKTVINHLKSKLKPIRLTVNKYNQSLHFYLNQGFKIIDEVIIDIGRNYVMDDYVLLYENKFLSLIKQESNKTYFMNIFRQLDAIKKTSIVYPKSEDIFKALYLTNYEDVKVVILGQDPYHQPNQAHGLAFSVNEGVKMPPSLVNIYKEIELEYGYKMSNNGNLTSWAKQGVLLLNAILTVTHNKPLSHENIGWQIFSDKVIELLQDKEYVVYILLGNQAKKYIKKITNKNHLILTTSHPSPLSSYRGFFGSDIFKKANQYLKEKGLNEVNWKN